MMENKILKEAFTALKSHPSVNYLCMDDDDLRAVLKTKIKEIKKEDGEIKALKYAMMREWRQMALQDYRYRYHVMMQGHAIVKALIKDINKFQKNFKGA